MQRHWSNVENNAWVSETTVPKIDSAEEFGSDKSKEHHPIVSKRGGAYSASLGLALAFPSSWVGASARSRAATLVRRRAVGWNTGLRRCWADGWIGWIGWIGFNLMASFVGEVWKMKTWQKKKKKSWKLEKETFKLWKGRNQHLLGSRLTLDLL